jgi:hypothetical protein
MRVPKHVPGTIVQDVPLALAVLLIGQVRTEPGADTQKIIEALGKEMLLRLQQIPCVIEVQALKLEELEVGMASKETH